ncbi:MAG: hypothetical protein DI570_01155 [Phenylobacterium zucineum]|nr:MAG: hypothetical protein DI570_01155 [Phenylobacterium zucineum]
MRTLLALGFDAGHHRGLHPSLAGDTVEALAAHYAACGRAERLRARFDVGLVEGLARIDRLATTPGMRRRLVHDLAASWLWQAESHGQPEAILDVVLRPGPDWRPLVVISDSHGGQYTTEEPLFGAGLLPVPLICNGASARGLGNPASQAGAGARIRAFVGRCGDQLAHATLLFKFGQVDLEFVHDYRRIRDGGAPFDFDRAEAFAADSARRYVDFLRGLRDLSPARIVVTAAFPPALNDEALREGYLNAHIVEMHGALDVDDMRRALRRLEMPSWPVRTELARRYNIALAAACASAGLTFHDDFTPMLGPHGLIDPEVIVWHGGTDHHLCFTSPAARRRAAEAAVAIAAL